ncbi:MAG: BatA and WFA domain-containing protein [Deltaproteobacteria bacterium]|nr:BatA and WFA domain-containing protein [Deltaproteobacteria bacterium]
MGFGLPWALAGLVAVAIPVIAHLLRRQKLPKQTLPTIAFLHRIHATRAARLRVVDMLLLITRALLVMALVLVAAAPYRVAQSSLLDRQHALAIVFDDSMSMAAIHEGKTLIERAADSSIEQLERLPEGSEVSVVLSGKPPRVWVRRRTDLEMAATVLDEIDPRSTRGDALCDAVRIAVELLLESELSDRRLLVLSDFAPGTRADECEWQTRGIRVVFETVSTPNPDNRRIASVEVLGERESGEGMRLEVEIAGTVTPTPQKIRLRQKGQETYETPVEAIDGGGGAVLTIPAGSTDAVVELRLDPDDVLPADNVRGVLLGSDTVHVLLVDGDPHPDPRKRETAFLSHALGVAPRIGRSFAVETLDAQDLSESAIIRSDVLVLANATLDEKWLPLIQRFVSGGGSLWITAGDRINPRAYGSVLRELLPGRYTATRMEARPVSLQSTALPELAQAKVQGRTPIAETALDAIVTARFSDGSPAMVEHRYRSGRVAMFATTVDDAWTDLPYQPVFVPFVLDTLSRLAGRTDHAVEPHSAVSLPGSTSSQRIQVVTPTGRTVDLAEADRVSFRDTGEIGAYRVLVNGVHGARFAFVVNAPPGESDLVSNGPPEADGSFQAVVSDISEGVEQPLAPWLLLFAIVLLFAELWLRQIRRR